MNTQAQNLLAQAKAKYNEAMEIRNGFKGNDVPAEEIDRLNTLLDEVEGLKSQADSLTRADNLADTFKGELPFGSEPEKKGAIPTLAVSENVKALGNIFGLPEAKASSFEIGRAYDADREAKRQIATAIYWKYGEKNLGQVLNQLPGELKGLGMELKDLATTPGAAGGYLVGDTQLNMLIELQGYMTAMRRLSNVLPPIPGGSAVTPAEDTELSDPEWTTEIGTGSDDTVAPFGQRALTPHPLAKRIKISRTLLRAANLLNVEAWVLNRLARKFSDAEENNFLNGDGSQKPVGLLEASITSVETAASNTLAADDIINWVYQLPAAYARRAVILCNRSLIRKIRLMRSDSGAGAGTGNYLWQPGLALGSPATILDFAYEISDFYPTGLTADAYDDNALVATIGDFSYYWIVDSLNFEVQRLEELYAATNQVGFIGRKETDGMVVATDAFRHLKIKA